MRAVRGLKFMFRSRGLGKGFRRLGLILKRFGFSPKKQTDRIEYYASLLKRCGIRGTFFIPGVVLRKYSRELLKIGVGCVDWGIHGDVHTDFSRLSIQMQETQMKNAVRLFDMEKLSFNGFRAPYLKTNEHTLDTVGHQNRFLFDSSIPILWDDCFGVEQKSFGFIQDFYYPRLHSAKASLPWSRGALVEIPVSLPDDDILVDREGLNSAEVLKVWLKILEVSHKKGELFVLQLHPERIYELGEVLEDLIRRARCFQPSVWVASLAEIAEWFRNKGPEREWPAPHESAFSVTGDIDSITLLDFFDRLRKW